MYALIPRHEYFSSQRSKYWIDRPLWGNRFYNDQSPKLVVLEFLTVLYAYLNEEYKDSSNSLSNEKELHPEIAIKGTTSVKTRSLIYGEPFLDILTQSGASLDDVDKWKKLGEESVVKIELIEELKNRVGDFDSLQNLVDYFRNATFSSGDKRWSSKFLFPYGGDCLFLDGRPNKSEGFSSDRRFFGRGGELLFYMLKRAEFSVDGEEKTGKDLFQEFNNRFFQVKNPTNELFGRLKKVLGDDTFDKPNISIGYLPFKKLSNYNALATDLWILLQRKLTLEVFFDYASEVIALHFSRYYLEQAKRVLEDIISFSDKTYEWHFRTKDQILHTDYENKDIQPLLNIVEEKEIQYRPYYLCLAPQNKNTKLKEEARRVYESNSNLGTEAIKKLEEQRMKVLGYQGNKEERVDELKAYHHKDSDIRASYISWLPKIGLVNSRGRRGYLLSPKLIRTLVITVIDERMELSQFLRALYEKYRIVIGASEAVRSKLNIEHSLLEENERLFIESLEHLGLLKSLSDDCAYVENPYK